MVRYQVQFKPINPASGKPITNESKWGGGSSSTTSGDYDSMLMFVRTNWPTSNSQHGSCVESAVTNLQNVPYDVWAVYAVTDTVKQAMKIAKPLISEYGLVNVQICKIAPAGLEIVFEEAQ